MTLRQSSSRSRRAVPMAAALVAVGALLAAPVTAASASPTTESVRDSRATARPVAPVEPLIPMAEVRVADFAAEAAELPPQLEQALARDVGMTGAEWLAQAEASAVGVEVVDALRDHVDVRAARLDGLELVVTVGSTADAAVVESVGARAEIGPEPARTSSPTVDIQPAVNLYGGMPYFFPPGARCSLGFNGVDTSLGNAPRVLTAGHCQGTAGGLREAMTISRAEGPTALGASHPFISGNSSSWQDIGPGGVHVIDDFPAGSGRFYDHGLISVTGAGWTPKPEIVTWGQTPTGAPLASDPLPIRDMGPALSGATICKSGATTGWTCGLVLTPETGEPLGFDDGVDQIVPVDTDTCPNTGSIYCVGATVAQICVRAGDSGGPAVIGNRAVGITSASSAGANCASDDLGVFSTLSSPLYENVTDIYPKWEPLIAVSTPSVTISDQVLSGTLEHGTTRHFVDVVLSTGEKFTTQVQADGSWSVNTASATPVTKTYTVTARWGKGSKSTPVSGTLPGIATERLFGSDRYATSVLISKNEFPGSPTPNSPRPEGVPVVYLANGASFPDALSAGPAAALEGGPLLLTPSSSLPASVAAELDRLNPTRIVIVGGTGVVSPAVAAAAAAYTPNPVIRLGGANRYETSRLIAQRMLSQGLATGQSLWVATGRNFPDALSAGAAAASQRVPILLVNGTASTLDSATSAFINGTLQSNRVYIAGGTGVVSEGIRIGIQNLASTGVVSREGGADRFATSLEINGAAFTGTAPEVFIAYGFNFPDALSGSVIAGLRGGPLYITRTTCVTPAIVSQIRTLDPSKLTVFGGTAIVSNNARDLKTC